MMLKGRSSSILLDYGAHTGREPSFPLHVKPRDVDSILLTHAHLDHSGGVPLFYIGRGPQLLTAGVTMEISMILLEDFIKLSGFYLPFDRQDLVNVQNSLKGVSFGGDVQVNNEFRAEYRNSGHIPGGATIVAEHDGRRVFYTGDVNLRDSQLLPGADLDLERDVDCVVIESTYSQTDHEPRSKIESDFFEFANEVVERGGILLVPAFSVGRAQEIACLLKSRNFKHPVVMDGMALKINDILSRNLESLRDPDLFRKTMESVEVVTGWPHRRRIMKHPCVIVSPAGMLAGGASVFYNKEISGEARNGISIVAFQVPGSPGRTLLERGLTVENGKTIKVKAEIRRFDFSGHAGRSELFELIGRLKGKPRVYAVHGDGDSCEIFAREITERYGLVASAPKNGDTVDI